MTELAVTVSGDDTERHLAIRGRLDEGAPLVRHVPAWTARTVVIADACFTAPAVITQFATGLWLMHVLGLPYTQLWIALALALFGLVGLCWLPVLWLQWRARELAVQAAAQGTPAERPLRRGTPPPGSPIWEPSTSNSPCLKRRRAWC